MEGSLVNGMRYVEGKTRSHVSPVTKEEWTTLCEIDDKGLDEALAALEIESLQNWTTYERADLLHEIASLLMKNQARLAEMITMEMGKPIREAHGEVAYAASYFTWYAEEAKRIYGKQIPSQFADKRLTMRYEPVGPCALITPWNFPIAMAGRKVAGAFAAGCPVIVKPSPETPVTFLTFGDLCLEAGLPKEALQIVIGPEVKIGEAFLKAPHIRKLSFTGSCKVGKLLYRGSAETVKKLTMELGGHAPLIVYDDADLDKAIEGALIAKFRQSGQTCVCANRLFIQEGIYPKFLERFTQRVKEMKIGNPLEESTDLTNTIHPISQKKTLSHIEDALKKGAKAHLNAKEPFEPEILTDVTNDMLIFNEETFGPVAAIATFKGDEEGIEVANHTPYGLASYVFTESLERAENAVSKLKFGVIGLNDGLPSTAQIPFGGIKASGFGREGGPTGIYEYLVEKLISQKL